MLYQKFENEVKKKLIENIEVVIEDELKSLKWAVKEKGCKLTKFRKLVNIAFHKSNAVQNFVYMSTDWDVKDEDYQEVQKKIFNFLNLSYFDFKEQA